MKIGDICESVSEPFKSSEATLVTLINTSDVADGKVTNHTKVANENLKGQFKKSFSKDDILYSEIRPCNKHFALIDFEPTGYIASTKLMVIRANKEIVIPAYLYHYLTNDKIIKRLQLLAETRSGTFPQITFSEISNLDISLPSIDRQEKIVAILSALDDKIEVNRAINKNLEATAQAIFKSWFIDFEPFGGVMPADWSLCSLDECCSLIARGITPKYDDQSVDFVINQKCIRNHSLDLKLSRKHNSKVPENKNLHYGDILINSTGQGTLGRTAQVIFTPNNLTVDSHITIVRPKYDLLIEYLGYLITSKEDDFVAMEQGSTGQTELPRERVKSYSIILPSEEKLDAFQKITKPILKKMYINQVENQRLAAIRDALLPKLMSGEIDVSQVKI